MKTCVFDNQATMRREWWIDGHMLGDISAYALDTNKSYPTYFRVPVELRAPFVNGRLIGDIGGLPKRIAAQLAEIEAEVPKSPAAVTNNIRRFYVSK